MCMGNSLTLTLSPVVHGGLYKLIKLVLGIINNNNNNNFLYYLEYGAYIGPHTC